MIFIALTLKGIHMGRRPSPFSVVFGSLGLLSFAVIVFNFLVIALLVVAGYFAYDYVVTNRCLEKTFNSCCTSSNDKNECSSLATERCK